MQIFESRKGAALLGVTVGVILLAISLSVALPGVKNDLQRQKEEQLRFVLKEFRQAVQKYQHCNKKLPQNIEQLLADEQGRRFLRQRYPDPFTKKFDWQFTLASDSFVVFSAATQPSLAGIPYSEFR
jgi:type II secretory pathway pseudopilin PulG